MYQAFENLARDLLITTGAAYAMIMIGGGIVQNVFSEKIRSQEDLSRMLDEEASKLGMEDKNVVGKFYKKGERGYRILGTWGGICGYDINNDKCLLPMEEIDGVNVVPINMVVLNEGFGATRFSLRHELYHSDRHITSIKNKLVSKLRYWLHDEPTAIIYALTGLKF